MPSPSLSPEHEIPFSFCVHKFPPFPTTFLVLTVPLDQNFYFTKNCFPIPPFVFSFTLIQPSDLFYQQTISLQLHSVKTTLPVCFRKCSFKCCFFPYSRSQPGNSQRYLDISKVFGPRLNSRVNLIFEPSKSSISSLFPFLWALFTCSLSNFEVSNLNIWVIIAMCDFYHLPEQFL